MTREEAIEQLKWYFEYDNGLSADKETVEAYRMAIKALEQEPCEDTISRQAVLNTLSGNSIGKAYKIIANMPPVQPKREHGKWICTKVTGEFENWNDYTCPFCKFTKRVSNGYTFTYKYCPTCGADMRRGDNNADSD